MPTHRFFLFIVFSFTSCVAFAQMDRTHFRRLSDKEQFKVADTYLIKHWSDFYDSTKRVAALSDYAVMTAEAKGIHTRCLLNLFWFRNQVYKRLLVDYNTAQKALANIDSLLAFTHEHQSELFIEEAICRLEWCIAILDHKGRMDQHTRRILVYNTAVQCLKVLESQAPGRPLFDFMGSTKLITIYYT